MAYEICYDLQRIHRRKLQRKYYKRPMAADILKISLFILIAYLVAVLAQYYLSGQAELALEAAEHMVSDLKDRKDLAAAAAVFCAELAR